MSSFFPSSLSPSWATPPPSFSWATCPCSLLDPQRPLWAPDNHSPHRNQGDFYKTQFAPCYWCKHPFKGWPRYLRSYPASWLWTWIAWKRWPLPISLPHLPALPVGPWHTGASPPSLTDRILSCLRASPQAIPAARNAFPHSSRAWLFLTLQVLVFSLSVFQSIWNLF